MIRPVWALPRYLGSDESETTRGYVSSSTWLEEWRLEGDFEHVLLLGSVDLQLAMHMRQQLQDFWRQSQRRVKVSAHALSLSLESISVPRGRELRTHSTGYSELALPLKERLGDPAHVREIVTHCIHNRLPLDLRYPIGGEWSGLRSVSRQLKVHFMTGSFIRGEHFRGVRNYSLDKVIQAQALNGDANRILPELAIKMELSSAHFTKLLELSVMEVQKDMTLVPVREAMRNRMDPLEHKRREKEQLRRNLGLR